MRTAVPYHRHHQPPYTYSSAAHTVFCLIILIYIYSLMMENPFHYISFFLSPPFARFCLSLSLVRPFPFFYIIRSACVYDIIFPGIELLFVRRMCSCYQGAPTFFFVRTFVEESCSKSRGLEAPVLSHYVYVHYTVLSVYCIHAHKTLGLFFKGGKGWKDGGAPSRVQSL